jgi:hypothetical protein
MELCIFPTRYLANDFIVSQGLWEEMDSIYRISAKGGVFIIDASPTGLIGTSSRSGKHIPRRIDITAPQLALGIPAANLPIPIDQLLAQIREQFSAQLERYNIYLGDERGRAADPLS